MVAIQRHTIRCGQGVAESNTHKWMFESDLETTEELIVLEPNKVGAEHGSFNAAVLTLLARRRGTGSIRLMCARSHWAAIGPLCGHPPEIVWESVSVISGVERQFFRKFILEAWAVLRALQRAKKTKADLLILSIFPNVLAFVLLLKRWFGGVRLRVILHCEVEALTVKEKLRMNREGFWAGLALVRLFDGTWPVFYILGERMKGRLLARFTDVRQFDAMRVLEHPYSFTRPKARARHDKFRVGFVGAGRIAKGIDEFFDLARSLNDIYSRLEFVVVGGVEKNAQRATEGVTVLAEVPGGLEPEKYAKEIGDLDCALFLYQQNYALTASGAVFDVINQRVEIWSLPNDYLSDLASEDSESGILFFRNLQEIERELRHRVNEKIGFKKYDYTGIRARHGVETGDEPVDACQGGRT